MSVFKNYAYYYDLLYRDKDYRSEYEYVKSLARLNDVSPRQVVELGCGSGSHACFFAEDSIDLDGVDISREMLELANAKRSGLDKRIAPRLNFHHGDVRNCRLNLKGELVLSLFHVASYQCSDDDVRDYFTTAREHCSEHGIFIFDFWHGPAVLKSPPYDRERKIDTVECSVSRSTKALLDKKNNLVKLDINLEATREDTDKIESINEKHVMRYFFAQELTTLLSEAGLELLNLYGWMKQTPPTDDDWYAIAVARIDSSS